MAHTISIKLAGKMGRIRIEGTNLESKVSDFRERISSVLEKQDTPDKFSELASVHYSTAVQKQA